MAQARADADCSPPSAASIFCLDLLIIVSVYHDGTDPRPNQAPGPKTGVHFNVQWSHQWGPPHATLMDTAENDVLAFMDYPPAHRAKLHSTNPLERLNKEVKRRALVAGIFPNEASITRLVGAILLEQNDEWALHHRYMTLGTMTELAGEPATPNLPQLAPQAA